MNFGVKEVMVIAALAFGIVVTGCSATPDASLAMSPPLRVYNAGAEEECKFCFSRYEMEFYHPEGLRKLAAAPAQVVEEKIIEVPDETIEKTETAGSRESFVSSWTPSLPSFMK